jgi:uncharacterized protein YbjT (DUF2867 family)
MAAPARKVVVCSAGFLGWHSCAQHTHTCTLETGKNIAQALLTSSIPTAVQLTSRSPTKLHEQLVHDTALPAARLLPPVAADITQASTLQPAFEGASMVVSLVGIMHSTPDDFERVQWRGAQNVARAAR